MKWRAATGPRGLAAATTLALALGAGAPVRAASVADLDIPAGQLADRVPALAEQAGVSISVASPALWRTQVKGVRGKLQPGVALARMLEGVDGRAVQLGPTSWRIERAPRKQGNSHAAASVESAPAEPDEPAPIIVTAGKMGQRLGDFAGTVHVIEGADIALGGERGTESILSRLATLSSTHMGTGRNKLFIRGLADSSFTGATQATVGQYLGDIRLNYNAPDPDLRLADIASVEVLEGSQGTLYGAGALAGIFRLIPNEPDPSALSAEATAGFSLTQHGDPGGDFSATANMPLGKGHALRFTAYGLSEGGYIDNPLRGVDDVNRTRIGGGRASLLLDAGDGWTVKLGGIYQATDVADAQYADRDGEPLTRSSPVEEGASADYAMASVIIARDFGSLRFQSSNAWVRQSIDERFNASAANAPAEIFRQQSQTRMLTSETRLWRPVSDGFGWVVGLSVLDNRTTQERAFERLVLNIPVTGASNGIREYTVFGKVSYAPLDWLVLSGGGRFTWSRLSGGGEDVAPAIRIALAGITAERDEREILPTAELLAHVTDGLALYTRYEESYRPGGLAIEGDFVRRFRSDHVSSVEAGLRWKAPVAGLSANLSASHVDWQDIQADFIDRRGFPTTANIGDGRIWSFAAEIVWRPTESFRLDIGAVHNSSRIVALSPEVARLSAVSSLGLPANGPAFSLPPIGAPGQFGPNSQLGRIPNVADYALSGNFDWQTPVGGEELQLAGWVKYLGPSRIGIGPMEGDEQGDYVDTGLVGRVGNARRGLTLTLTNILDSRGNRFALGTPFETATGRFITPQRPRTLRIAIDTSF